jgi:precorrin-2 dehydrogenase/sirohydrochlorin ferrochelatase
MLDVRGRRCLVVGAGRVALGKARALLAQGAAVTLIAPDACPDVVALARSGDLEWKARPYALGDVAGFRLVFAATDSRAVNAQVAAEAEAAGIWANVADTPEICAFAMPAVLRRGALEVAVGTSSTAPFAAARVRDLLDQSLDRGWEAWLEVAAAFREVVVQSELSPEARRRAYDAFVAATLQPGELIARPPLPAEAEAILRRSEAP